MRNSCDYQWLAVKFSSTNYWYNNNYLSLSSPGGNCLPWLRHWDLFITKFTRICQAKGTVCTNPASDRFVSNKSVFSHLRRLVTWHCPHVLLWRRCCWAAAGRAAIDSYLLPAGPTAANPPWWFAVMHACSLQALKCWSIAGANRQTDRQHTITLTLRAVSITAGISLQRHLIWCLEKLLQTICPEQTAAELCNTRHMIRYCILYMYVRSSTDH